MVPRIASADTSAFLAQGEPTLLARSNGRRVCANYVRGKRSRMADVRRSQARSGPPSDPHRHVSLTALLVAGMAGLLLGLIVSIVWTAKLGIAVGVVVLLAAMAVPMITLWATQRNRGREGLGGEGSHR